MEKKLYRSRKNRMLFGVCGGLAEYFNVDPTLVRILFIILLIGSVGTAVLLYLLLAVVMPEEPKEGGEEVGKEIKEE
ncbi:PspC domain-containing protein [Thermococcus argininiproducens]|uniref:PspC domain-containing protein n=1 Tax=Thermococcus argininiproducens TaxID=2866384 RepID=A0A9E7SBZ9_9EURY|nr:PspC domain-containing protein [Thermococcus argininiproducens]USG99275.1 PspC domain-containing protein [Thermococcus argininiproducens]